MCGDYGVLMDKATGEAGSPPHVRGLHHRLLHLGSTVRITPACAGTTSRGPHGFHGQEDHPRMCGDYWVKDPSSPVT